MKHYILITLLLLCIIPLPLLCCDSKATDAPPPPPKWSITGHVLIFNKGVYDLRQVVAVTPGYLYWKVEERLWWQQLDGYSSLFAMNDAEYIEFAAAIAQAWNNQNQEQNQ